MTVMTDFPLFDFVAASLLMGLGIGADVALATLARAGSLNHWRTAAVWIVGVSLTHTLFPMAGYLLTYFSIQVQPAWQPLIGIIAFTCIAVYLRGEFAELLSSDDQISDQVNGQGEDRNVLVTLGLILAVSWDALWSGPAKSAQVIGWPELLIWLSFIVVGMLVSLMALLSMKFAVSIKHYSEKQSSDKQHASKGLVLWLQYSVIAYFGVLALLRYTFNFHLFWWQNLLIASIGVAAMMATAAMSKQRKREQMAIE